MGLDANFTKARVALKFTNLELDTAEMEYSCKAKKGKKNKERGEFEAL